MKTKCIMYILKEFCAGKMDKREAVKSLEEVEPIDLYLAEVELVSDGFGSKDLKNIADIYETLLSGKSNEFYETLIDEHPLKILMTEHKKLRRSVYVCDNISKNISNSLTVEQETILKLLVDNLYELDKHIRREEEVIFPRLKERDMSGRTILLSDEHEDLKELRTRLRALLTEGRDTDDIIQVLDDMIYTLREHSFIENDLLYPTAFDVLDDWDEIAAECDKIGGCEFVPIS